MTECKKQDEVEQNEIDRFAEMQRHMNDPMYWVSRGRTPPHLQGKRPNKMGYYYLVVGVFMLIASVLFAFENILIGAAILFSISALVLAAGVALLRPRGKKEGSLQTEATKADPMWTCSGCGEQIEHNFDVCWNCGTGRDGAPPEDPNAFG